ncbi:hypothetical protein FSP39_015791 [Pinctada imbricata]|uniref:BTB domain-containing protein n=1 Tax=Pinctada imbricata TaxID=66713 RepID=A0AA88YKE6_PINIB|nr:hypothetical protein FSP39_015791 [Pinctada imbricata]
MSGGNEAMEITEDTSDRSSLLLKECIEKIGVSGDYSDVNFVFPNEENKTLHAHKFVLAARSSVFGTMFYGSLPETGDITLQHQTSRVFHDFLRYLYTDDIDIDGNTVTELLYTSKMYGVACLTEKCDKYLEENLAVDNACTVLNHASLFDLTNLFAEVKTYIEINAKDVFQADDFKNLSRKCLSTLLESENLTAAEAIVLKSVLQWAEQQCELQSLEANGENKRKMLGDLLYKIRLPCLKLDDFSNLIAETGVLTNEEELCFYRYFTKGSTTGELDSYCLDKRIGKPLMKVDLIQLFGKTSSSNSKEASENLIFRGGDKAVYLHDIEFHGLSSSESLTSKRNKPMNVTVTWKETNKGNGSVSSDVLKLTRDCKGGRVILDKEVPVNTNCEMIINVQMKCETCGELASLPYSRIYHTRKNPNTLASSMIIYKKYKVLDNSNLTLELRGDHILKSMRFDQNPTNAETSS